MKNNLDKLVIVVFLGSASFLARAAEPKTLEEALLNYNWEWLNITVPGKTPGVIRFDANGTAGGQHPNWHWKITGPRTVIAYDSISEDGKASTWKAELKYDETFSKMEGAAIDSNHNGHYTGRRLELVSKAEPVAGSGNTHNPDVVVYKPDDSKLKILSEQGPNVQAWVTAPLYQ